MKAKLFFMQSYDAIEGLENFIPNKRGLNDSVDLLVHLDIGISELEASDIFHLRVCTPDNVEDSCSDDFCICIKHTLVVKKYDYAKIRQFIEGLIDEVRGDSWPSIATELNKYFGWEFEDYVSHLN
jgi:hypothetical protein